MLLGLAIMSFDHGKGGVGVLRRHRSNFCVVVWCAAVLECETCCERGTMFLRDSLPETKTLNKQRLDFASSGRK